ncbi:MAG: sulfotransferase family 2 domain-containing protein [Cyanobacteria bacterium P01_H01_bin.58]
MFLSRFLQNLNLKSGSNEPSQEVDAIILNEAVNFDLQTIFVAIPKTGTTSIRDQIKSTGQPLIAASHLSIIQIRDVLYTYLLRMSLGKNTHYPTQGVLSDVEVREKRQQVFNSFFKFSSVRNPWARVVSLYLRREGIQVSEAISFTEFCESHFYSSDTCIHPTLHINQLDWLVDESGEVIMDYVYKMEEIDEAIKEISDRTDGRVQLKNIRSNQNPQSKSTSYRDLYTDYTRQLIAKRFEKDIDFFEYVF